MLVSTHGGHFVPNTTVSSVAPREIDATVQPLADRSTGGAGRLPLGLTPRRFILMNLLNEGLDAAGVDYEGPIIHAGAAETMIVVAVAKGLVRTDELEPGVEGEVSPAECAARESAQSWRTTSSGTHGRPPPTPARWSSSE